MFKSIEAAIDAAPEGTAEKPSVIGIEPNVYLLPGGASGASLSITKNYLTLIGLTNNRRSVVLADNRGNAQGATDNGYVIVVNATGFTARNLTILNYCNAITNIPAIRPRIFKTLGCHHAAVALQARAISTCMRTSRPQPARYDVSTDHAFLFKNVFIEGTTTSSARRGQRLRTRNLLPLARVMSAGNIASSIRRSRPAAVCVLEVDGPGCLDHQ